MKRKLTRNDLRASVLLLALWFLPVTAFATPNARTESEHPLTPDRVLGSLNQALAWYGEARVAMRAVGTVFAREDEQTALAVLRRAFETARAEAAVLALGTAPGAAQPQPDAGPLGTKRSKVRAAIEADEREIVRLRQQLRSVPRARRPALQEDLAAAENRLELARVRLEFLSKLEESDIASSGPEADLARQIQTLEASLPELRAGSSGTSAAPTPPEDGTSGNRWGHLQRLIAIHHARGNLAEFAERTATLERNIGTNLQATQASLHSIVGQLRALTSDPSPNGSLADGQRLFRHLLKQNKQLGAVLLSLREESALVRRFAGDLEGWKSSLDRERWQILQSLGIGLIGVVFALAVILVGGTLWRVAAMRYVQDVYRRRLLLAARNVVVVTAMMFVVVFHFASELTALVTGLGFAAAGIAFALQNVILALAGYFSMAAPNGIRVGDRVSLQGPFGYVQGEVLDIGLVRIRLRELAGDPLRSTGRIVVFPNSVAFTGSFFKHPPSEDWEGRHRGRNAAA